MTNRTLTDSSSITQDLSVSGQVALDVATVPAANVSGLGALATQSTVNLSSQVTGSLAYSSLSGAPALGALATLSTAPIANGGTGQTSASAGFNALSPMTTAGDFIYGGTSGAGTRLAAGSQGTYLEMGAGNVPAWANPFSDNWTTSGQLLTNGSFTSNLTGWTAGTGWTWNSGGGAAFTSSGGYALSQQTGNNYTAGTVYKVTIQLTLVSGSPALMVQLSGVSGSTLSRLYAPAASGTYVFYFNSPGAVSGEGLLLTAFGSGSAVVNSAMLERLTFTQKTLIGGLSIQGGSLTLSSGTEAWPSLSWNQPDLGPAGFSQTYDGSVWFSQAGAPVCYINDENGFGAGVASIISFQGSNRGTIEAAGALVLRSLGSHLELEGGTNLSPSAGIDLIPYKGGTSTGVPWTIHTDATTPANFTAAFASSSSGQDAFSFLQVQNHSGVAGTALDGLGNVISTGSHGIGVTNATLTTNAATSSGSAVLNFASVPSTITPGMRVFEWTSNAVIPASAVVLSTTSTTVTISANATGAGVASGDVIQFWAYPTTTWCQIAAGSTGKSQINLASSTAPTSPNNGDIWFDGAVANIRTNGTTTPVTSPAYSIVPTTFAISNVNTAQSFLPSGAQNFPVQAGINYRFHAFIQIDRTASGSNSTGLNFVIATGGGAAFSSITYKAEGAAGATLAIATYPYIYVNTTAAASLVLAANTSRYNCIEINGNFAMSAGGTIQPQIQFVNTPGAAPNSTAYNFFEIYAYGTASASAGLS